MTGKRPLILIMMFLAVGTTATHLQRHSDDRIIEADRRMMSRLETCYQRFKPDALLSNHRPGKWVTQIWQKDRLFGNLSRDSILLSLPTVPVYDFLDPNQLKSYIIYKDPGNWGPLTILIKPQRVDMQFAKVSVLLILNDTVDLSDAIKLTTFNSHQVYSYSTFCAPPGQYRIILQGKSVQEPLQVELVHRYEQLHQGWPHLDQVAPVKIRCRSRKQNKQMLVKWDKSNVDGNQMQYCISINHQRNMKSFCEAIAQKMTNESVSCKKFDFLHEGFSNKVARMNTTRRLDTNGTSIFCTGTRSQQVFRRFKPNMNYYIDVFGVHPNLSQLTFHLGSLRMWHSNKNFTIPLAEGRTGHGKLSQSNDLVTFSYKPLNTSANEIMLYIVPCGGTVMVRIVRQKRLLVELRHIHKPVLHKINMTQLAHLESGRLMIKILPNSVDEALRNIKVELTATSMTNQMRAYPKNLSLVHIPLPNSCKSVEIMWHPVPESKTVRYCILLMVATAFENFGLCGIDERIFKHPRFQQLHCFYSKMGAPTLERIKLMDLSPKSSYIVYLTATLTRNKETVKYEPLRIHPERFCNLLQDEDSANRGLHNDTSANHLYSNQLD